MSDYKSLFSFGFYVLIVIACIIFCVIYTKKTKSGGADERQILFQGKACSYAFFAMLFSNFLSLGAIRTFNFSFHTEIFFLISIMIGGAVLLIVNIWTDSLITRVETKKVWIWFAIIWLGVITKFVYNVVVSSAIENKILLISIIFVTVAVIISVIAKCLVNSKKVTEN